MTVLVAIPYWRASEYIEQAVDGVLAQSHSDLVCLVCGDGEEPKVRRADSRLVVLTFPTNLGAPATQQAMLLGSPFSHYAAHGADDWTDPKYLAGLIDRSAVATGSRALWHEYPDAHQLVTGDRAYVEFGCFSTDLLRMVGGYGLDRCCGQDTLLYADLLPHFAEIAWSDEPLYHKRIRAGSLTTNPGTGFGSAYRSEVFVHNRDVSSHCASLQWDANRVRAYRETLVPASLREPMAERVEMVRSALA